MRRPRSLSWLQALVGGEGGGRAARGNAVGIYAEELERIAVELEGGEQGRPAIVAGVIATTGLWIALGALGALLFAGAAGLFLLLAMGRLSLDLGWGRSVHELGPITMQIAAPRDLVFEMISAPYLGRTPGGSGIEVLAKGEGLAVATHHTKLHFYTSRTVELIEFEPPGRVGFRHLAGPVPHAVESFTLSEADGVTEIGYAGELGIDFFALGRLAGRHWVRPQWESVVREHLEDLKARAEPRATRRAAREAGKATQEPTRPPS